MLIVKSYISKDGSWYNDLVQPEEYSKFYIEFEKNNEKKFSFLKEEDRLYGFVDVQYHFKPIINNTYFGTITDMWYVYFHLIEEFLRNGEAIECYPDYECYISLNTNSNNGITIKIGDKTNNYDIQPNYFCKEILEAAKSFFETKSKLDKLGNSKFIEESINPLLEKL
ncbi:hypothetical protein V7056_17085 [Bacillus sp. JJ664]